MEFRKVNRIETRTGAYDLPFDCEAAVEHMPYTDLLVIITTEENKDSLIKELEEVHVV